MDVEALQKMTVAELREEAKKMGDVKGLSSMKKDALVHLLADSGSAASGATRKGKAGGGQYLPAMKKQVQELKARRTAAGAKGQKTKVMEFSADLKTLRRRLRRAARRRRKAA